MNPATSPYSQRVTREKLVLTNGVPVTVALEYEDGKRVASLYSGAADQVFYSLTDGRCAYWPLEAAQQIARLGLQPGEPFTICKYGPRSFEIARANTPQTLAPAPQSPTLARKSPTPAPTPPAPVNGQGEDAAAILARCYADAIAITLGALEQARSQGLHILPTHEGLQACAATLFINGSRL